MEVFIEYFHKVMNGLQIAQVIVVNVYTDAEVETRIASIYNFEIAKLQGEREGEHEVEVVSIQFNPQRDGALPLQSWCAWRLAQ